MTNEQFRALRYFLGMTQQEFAAFLGVSKATVSRVETGDMKVSPKLKARIVSKLTIDKEFMQFYENLTRWEGLKKCDEQPHLAT